MLKSNLPWVTALASALFLILFAVNAYAQQNFGLYVYYYPDCFGCMEKMNTIVVPFYESHRGSVTPCLLSLNNQSNQQLFYKDFEADMAYILSNNVGSPFVMLKTENRTLRIYGENLTIASLDKALNTLSTSNPAETNFSAVTPGLDMGIAVAVISAGIFSGINPCLIAFITYMTSASIQTSPVKTRLSIFKILTRVSIISAGVVAWYFLFGIAFHGVPLAETTALKLIAIAILAVLGLAHIIFSGNPDSTLFHTPHFLKSLITTHSRKSNYAFDFILGVAFALIKTPCLVGPYLVILNWLTLNTALASFYILIFNLGIILPLFLIAAFLSAGIVNISTIDRFRIQGRNTIRLLTGILLVSTAILLLIF